MYDEDYQFCEFSIIHPYFDDIKDHIEFTFEDAKISLSPINGSVKGDNNIKLFRLMETAQSVLRGAASMRKRDIQLLNKSARKKAAAVIVRKYAS